MKRLLPAAVLALALHAGLFWWGQDWVLQASKNLENRPDARPLHLALDLAKPGPPGIYEAAGELRPGPGSKDPKLAASIRPKYTHRPTPSGQPSDSTQAPPQASLAPKAEGKAEDAAPAQPLPAQQAELKQPMTAAGTALRPSTPTTPSSPSGPETGSLKKNQTLTQAAGQGKERPDSARTNTMSAEQDLRKTHPGFLFNPPPPYPPMARRRNQAGTVLLAILVDKSGQVRKALVVESSGTPMLDRAAVGGVASWRFEPGRHGSKPVAAWVEVPVRFCLREASPLFKIQEK